jgi:hypothetical protein
MISLYNTILSKVSGFITWHFCFNKTLTFLHSKQTITQNSQIEYGKDTRDNRAWCSS